MTAHEAAREERMSTENAEALIERVLAEHSIGAFCGTDTACSHDRTWRTNARHRAHVAAAITQALGERDLIAMTTPTQTDERGSDE